MLLLALQTTATASDDRRIDAITLVLVVVFIVAMAALSLLLIRRERETPPEGLPVAAAPDPPQPRVQSISPPRPERPTTAVEAVPAWLQGVTFPNSDISLVDATRLIEALLAARRDQNLASGLQLYSPEMLESLQTSLSVDAAGLVETLSHAEFDGEPPILRAVEVISSTGHGMAIRAGYANGASEIYRLVRIDGQWLIESIATS